MRALLAVLVHCLCYLGASAAGLSTLDQGSLLQKSSKIDDAPKLADDARGSLLLPALAKQVPGMEDMLSSSNMTMQDVMLIAQQVLTALKDQVFVDLVNSTLRDGLTLVDDWIKAALARIAQLETDGKNVTGEEDSYVLLTSFYKNESKEAMALADVAFDKFQALKDGAPKNLTAAFVDLNMNSTDFAAMLKTSLGDLFDWVANSTNTTLCKHLGPSLKKIKFADDLINGQMIPMFDQVRSMLPSIGPMVGMMVPEVADTVTDLANYTVTQAEPILISFGQAFQSEVQTLTQIGTVHSHCSFGSSGSVRSGPGMLLLAIALAAWSSLRA